MGRALLFPRDFSSPAGEVARVAGSDEPESTVAAVRASATKPVSCWRIYGWFTEGFDTADLQEARALLEALT